MEKIRFSTNMVFVFDYKKQIATPIKLNDRVNSSDYIFVYSEYDNFMKYNPPCKGCLVCNMCIKEQNNSLSYMADSYLHIKICDKLKSFINDNKLFYIKEWNETNS